MITICCQGPRDTGRVLETWSPTSSFDGDDDYGAQWVDFEG